MVVDLRHGRAYYLCRPGNNNRGRPDNYAGHPKTLYLREDAILASVGRFLSDRLFGQTSAASSRASWPVRKTGRRSAEQTNSSGFAEHLISWRRNRALCWSKPQTVNRTIRSRRHSAAGTTNSNESALSWLPSSTHGARQKPPRPNGRRRRTSAFSTPCPA